MRASFALNFVRNAGISLATLWGAFAVLSDFSPSKTSSPEHAEAVGYLIPSISVEGYIKGCCTPIQPRFFFDDWERVKRMSSFSAIGYVREHAQEKDLYLAYRFPDFAYYARKPLIRELDPVLEPYYQKQTTREAFDELRRLGVTHIYLPPHEVLTLTFSKTYDIVSNPTLATLLEESRSGMRLFRLADRFSDAISPAVPVMEFNGETGDSSPNTGWSNAIKNRVSHTEPPVGQTIANGSPTEVAVCFGTTNCNGSYRQAAEYEARPFLEHDKPFRITTTLSGYGKVRASVLVTQPSPQRTQRMYVPLWTTAASRDGQTIGQVFWMPQDTRGLSIVYTLDGSGDITVTKVLLEALATPPRK